MTDPPTIREFLLRCERAACRICTLPEAVREQLRIAEREGIRPKDQVAYLLELGIDMTINEIVSHWRKGHEETHPTDH